MGKRKWKTKYAVEMKQITKKFLRVVANDHVNFELVAGEVHAILGENGAGKTTLMNILFGLYHPDEGEIYIQGRKVSLKSPREAINRGIGMIHQHSSLVRSLTVLENILLGLKSSKAPFLDTKKAEEKMKKLSEKYHIKIGPRDKIWQLSVGERRWVEILQILYRDANVLILDEPTTTLTPQEVEELFEIIRNMTKEGRSVVFITHKIKEVLAISDRITVLRDGKVVGTKETDRADIENLAKMMVGQRIDSRLGQSKIEKGDIVLEVGGLKALGDNGLVALKGVSFAVRQGEILGIAGVSGNGQRELAETIMGMRKAVEGKLLVDGQNLTNKSTKEIIQKRVGYIPEDRINYGLLMNFSVAHNMILGVHRHSPFAESKLPLIKKKLFLNQQQITRYAKQLISEFDVRTPSELVPVKHLSGGNLQKLILARILSQNPRLLIACQPTRGLDIKATEFIKRKLLEEREKGKAILLISTDLDEILSVSDRIAVMFAGEIMGVMSADKVEISQIGLMMAGMKDLKS